MTGVVSVAALALLSLAGCSEDIATGPTTADLRAEREALSARLEKGHKRVGARAGGGSEAVGSTAAAGFAGVDFEFIYDPAGRRDPFRSVRWERQKEVARAEKLGPLERFELEQLAVVAVIWDTNRARALLADPSGRSYMVKEGSRVGKNEGRVIHIGDDLVLVKETYVDFGGEQTTKDVELRIRRSEGG